MSAPKECPSSRRKKTGDGNLTKIAYLAVKNDIMLNRIRAGECLSACQLAKKLHMSRTPVREAISILENEGFVEIRNGVGFFVRNITVKDIVELVEVRAALECSALESSTLKLDQAGLKKLLENWARLKADYLAGAPPALEDVVALDYDTHDFLVECSRNSYLIDLIKNISVRFRRIQYLSVMALDDTLDTINQHLMLLQSIQDGDIQKAVRLLKDHIHSVEIYMFRRPDFERRRNKSAG